MNKALNHADIQAFVLIAQAGSFTLAAEHMQCSRSHLSKQLLKLEKHLGVKLIVRTTRSQRLTEQGKLFYQQCSRAFADIDNAVEQVIDNANGQQGQLNINCVGGFIGEEIVTALINQFITQYPKIKVNLDFTSQRVDLVSGEFDFVFRMGHLQDSNLIARKLTDLSICTLASPSYLKQYEAIVSPKDLKNHRCITGSVKQWLYCEKKNDSNRVEVNIDGSFSCKNGRAMKNSALAGNGIVRLPQLYCQEEIDNGLLVPVFTEWKIPDTPLYLVYLQNKFQPARLKLFVEFVKKHLDRYLTHTPIID